MILYYVTCSICIGSDYISTPVTVTIPPIIFSTSTSDCAIIPIINDQIPEADETFLVTPLDPICNFL